MRMVWMEDIFPNFENLSFFGRNPCVSSPWDHSKDNILAHALGPSFPKGPLPAPHPKTLIGSGFLKPLIRSA
jgi:hypothetical protein